MENEVCRREIGHVAHSVLGEIYGPSFNLKFHSNIRKEMHQISSLCSNIIH